MSTDEGNEKEPTDSGDNQNSNGNISPKDKEKSFGPKVFKPKQSDSPFFKTRPVNPSIIVKEDSETTKDADFLASKIENVDKTEDEKEIPEEDSTEKETESGDESNLSEKTEIDAFGQNDQNQDVTEIKTESIPACIPEVEEKSTRKLDIGGKIRNLFENEIEPIENYNPEEHGEIAIFNGFKKYEEQERYWLNEPYCFAVILYDPNINDYLYHVVEPDLNEFEEVFLAEIRDRLRNVLLVEDIPAESDREKVLEMEVRKTVRDYAIEVTPMLLAKILYYIKRDFVRFGKIDGIMHDEGIEDISENGHNKPIFLFHHKYQNIATNILFEEDELDSFIIQLAQKSGKHISIAEPMIDATMPDGSRIQMTLGTSVTTHGSTFTIRRFNEKPITPVDLIDWGTFSSEQMAYLWLCIENNKSLIFAGGTASGKTSSLNAVSLFIPEKAKIISLEDTRELKLPHVNWIPGITRDSFTADDRGAVDMYDLLKAALRQRPEFLLVGEVRGHEALTLFQAMSTGHTTFSTMHADSVASAIHRLENPPISVPRNMIQALDIMSIQAQTYSQGRRVRRNIKLVEITDIDPHTRNIRTSDVFTWDSTSDFFRKTGESKALEDIKMRRGWNDAKLAKELDNRRRILEHMIDNKISDFGTISSIINQYQSIPDRVMEKLGLDS